VFSVVIFGLVGFGMGLSIFVGMCWNMIGRLNLLVGSLSFLLWVLLLMR